MKGVEELAVQRVLQRFEHEIVKVNRKNIGEITGEVSNRDLLSLGEAISICRAKYLKSVLEVAKNRDETLEARLASEVRTKRLLYEETMQGFAALRTALERGYVVIREV